jgi:predicted chitinase
MEAIQPQQVTATAQKLAAWLAQVLSESDGQTILPEIPNHVFQ